MRQAYMDVMEGEAMVRWLSANLLSHLGDTNCTKRKHEYSSGKGESRPPELKQVYG